MIAVEAVLRSRVRRRRAQLRTPAAHSPRILDVSAGARSMWFDAGDTSAVFIDIRAAMLPDIIADSRALPFADACFDLVVFDPPHVSLAASSEMAGSYGRTTAAGIRELVTLTTRELARVAKPTAFMAMKWNDHDQQLGRILALVDAWRPLFGQRRQLRDNVRGVTTWLQLVKATPHG